MSDARHTPPGDASFRRSLLRNAGGAVGLVILVALVFWGIGSIGGADDDALTAGTADGAAEEPDAEDPTEEPTEEPDPPADEPEAEEPEAEDPTEEPTEDPEPAEEPEDEPDADEPGAADEDDGDDAPPARTVDPASVTVQVLDGVKDDGGTAADAVADQLSGDGYQVIARNDAISYDVTTVLFNPGNEQAAQQIASELGGAEVRQQPGNLSTQVALHVVVGRDRA